MPFAAFSFEGVSTTPASLSHRLSRRNFTQPLLFRSLLLGLGMLLGLGAMGCEPELGSPCGAPSKVNPLIRQAEGTNEVIQDVTLDNCSTALCASNNGSRPFCTQTCEADSQCSDAPGFRCDVITTFGPLGCTDYEKLGNTCLKPDGTPSDNLTKYCISDKASLASRDEEFGREPWDFAAGTDGGVADDTTSADAGVAGENP